MWSQLDRFDNDDAWRLGAALVAEARRRDLPVVVDISRGGQQLFHAALPGTAMDNDAWVRRKSRVVTWFGHSSLHMGLPRRRDLAGREVRSSASSAASSATVGHWSAAPPVLTGAACHAGRPGRTASWGAQWRWWGRVTLRGDHVPTTAHALVRRTAQWLNSEPLGLARLRGGTVLVNFWALTCINWLRQEPHVRAWWRAYRDDGLVVVGVHTPEFLFEHEIDRVHQAVKEREIDYPVVLDNDYATGGSIAYRFHARDAHLVLSPGARGPIPFRLLLDGRPPSRSHGVDIDEEGNGVLADGRLYQLVREPGTVQERTLEITFQAPGVEAYVFTFG